MSDNSERPIVWLVDENASELHIHSQILDFAMPECSIREFPAPARREGVLDALNHKQTSCFLLDQKLRETGVADYDGTDLARFIGALNPQIPVFILTKFPDEWGQFSSSSGYIEDVLDKKQLQLNTLVLERLVARVRRRIAVYREDRDSRQRRMEALLKKSLSEELTSAEMEELDGLEITLRGGEFAAELSRVRGMDTLLKEHRDLMLKYNKIGG